MAYTVETAAQIIEMFKRLVDDESIESELALDLLNTEKTLLEEEYAWRFLLVVDTSNSFTSANDYATAFSLPDYFSREHKIALVDSNNNEDEILPIPFEERVKHKDTSNFYTIDYQNGNFYITGNVSEAQTIHNWYFKISEDLEIDDEPVWPKRFRRIFAYRMAEYWLSGIDADTLTRLMWPTHKAIADRLYSAMIKWDKRLWLKSMNNRTGFAERREGYRSGHIPDLIR